MAGPYDNITTYLTGIDAQGRIVAKSFATWNGDAPASYGATSNAAKWGAPTAGTGATITYSFGDAAQWTGTEKAAVLSTFSLWSAVANVRFLESTNGNPQLLLDHRTGTSSAGIDTLDNGTIGGSIGTARSAHFSLGSDLSFGSDPSADGGYAWGTLFQSVGHVLGLGNAGPYRDFDLGDRLAEQVNDLSAFTAMSNRVLLLISYEGQSYHGVANYNFTLGEEILQPTTWQRADILAIQRLYGMPTQSPLLAGGITFGFNSNLSGPLAQHFDFNRNQQPIVTLWSPGRGNVLDLSGFSTPSVASLMEGSLNDVGGLVRNLSIAEGTRIDTIIGGSGDDMLSAHSKGAYVIGGAGADYLQGGASNDHIYGGGLTALPDDEGDSLFGGPGGDYLQGNGGDDELFGDDFLDSLYGVGGGSDRIYGGQGNDLIAAGSGNDSANGNLGNDTIAGRTGNDLLRGGRGDDLIDAGPGDDQLFGDRGVDTLDGGDGQDIYHFNPGDALFATSGADAYRFDEILLDQGTDQIHLAAGIPSSVRTLGTKGDIQTAVGDAEVALAPASRATSVVTAEVGTDMYLFYKTSAGVEAIRLTGIADGQHDLELSDFI